jgi:general secretion pathway protein L
MSLLVVMIPPRPRLSSGSGDGYARSTEVAYVLSPDGLAVGSHGRCAPALLPRADSVLAVLADTDVAWHRVTLPKAPAARLRAALVGVLEEALLDEPETTHLAVAPGALANQPAWIAAVHKPWLAAELAALEKAGVEVERVLPLSWPDEVPLGHFTEAPGSEQDSAAAPMLVLSDADGVACVRLQGTLARALQATVAERPLRWSAEPAVAAPAERWLGAPVMVLSPEQRALQATRSLWNLRQFDLASRHRGARALRDLWLRFLSPSWRPVRWGLVGLAALNVLGLNLWAWQLHAAVTQREQQRVAVFTTAFPKVPGAGYEPALQMQRQVQLLRTAAGRAGEDDFEALLQAAAAAWPADRPPAPLLRFEPGRLTLGAGDWTPRHVEDFRAQLRPSGWAVDSDAGTLVLHRAAGGRS